MITLQGHIKAKDYENTLADQVHVMVQALFPNGDGVFQDYKAPVHTAHIVQFSDHEDELSLLPWSPQSPDLKIIEPLWRKCVITIDHHHRYLNLPPFCRKNDTRFPWKTYRNCIYPFRNYCKLF
ncbi:hypothetical protein AVEN_253145-1 [Araneus ventricosus]|uniref:Tc1-like transposase DDE domain-containing protein n=1 Tax=Araneus ventricosus TaxID=182803 RepID=A0A4Y2T7P8_ARAVE|nr:hypothetical protein AVEN_253145-1 [Araneus ventricosus]